MRLDNTQSDAHALVDTRTHVILRLLASVTASTCASVSARVSTPGDAGSDAHALVATLGDTLAELQPVTLGST